MIRRKFIQYLAAATAATMLPPAQDGKALAFANKGRLIGGEAVVRMYERGLITRDMARRMLGFPRPMSQCCYADFKLVRRLGVTPHEVARSGDWIDWGYLFDSENCKTRIS